MSIHVHQPLVWYMTNKHAAGYVALFKGSEMEALERRGSFSCPGVTLCQPRWQHSLAWVRSALSNMWWYTHVQTQTSTHTGDTRDVLECMLIHSPLSLCCHHVVKTWYTGVIKQHYSTHYAQGTCVEATIHNVTLSDVQWLFVWYRYNDCSMTLKPHDQTSEKLLTLDPVPKCKNTKKWKLCIKKTTLNLLGYHSLNMIIKMIKKKKKSQSTNHPKWCKV